MNQQLKIIEANAGTGKTFCLSTRLLHLLVEGVPANRIVALTFTKKAAGEIQSRVFQRLAEASLSENQAKTLSEQLERKVEAPQFYGKLLESLLAGNHRITISTIDSFFHQIARLFSSELSLPINWKLYDQNEYKNLVIDTIVYALSNTKNFDAELSVLLQLLNEDEIDKSVVQKAYRLVAEILHSHRSSKHWHFETGSTIEEDKLKLALTLLKNSKIPEGKTGPLSSWVKAIEESLANFSNRRWEDFLKKGLPHAMLGGQNTYYNREITADFAEPLNLLIQHAKNKILEAYRKKYLVSTRLIELLWNCFQELKHSRAIVTYTDIENSLASNSYSHEDLYLRLDNRIDHFLIDEFQDTSITQWGILEPFFNEFISNPGKSCFVVGDKKQAIYGWRGGESKLFDKIKNSYRSKSIEQLNLSYRSAKSVIENVNRIFSKLETNEALINYADIAKKWSEDFMQHSTIINSDGYVRYEYLEDELDFNKISEVINNFNSDTKIGILVQKNELVEEIIQKLSELSPPILASQEGGSYLSSSDAVRVILAAIKLLENPTDSEQFFIICCSPLGRSVPRLESAISYSAQLFESLKTLGFASFVNNLTKQISSLASHSECLRLKRVVDMACSFTNSDYSLFCEQVERTKFSAPSEERIRVMTIHQSKGLEFDVVILPDLNMSLEERYSQLIHISDNDSLIPYPNQLIRQLSPELDAAFKSNQRKKVDESLSVLYVALTRAKEALFIFLSKQKGKQLTLNNILLSEFFPADSSETIVELG